MLTLFYTKDEPRLVSHPPNRPNQVQRSQTNRCRLDSIGIGGFGHDFKALDNKNTSVVEVFDSFDDANTDFFSRIIFFLGPVFPTLQNLFWT